MRRPQPETLRERRHPEIDHPPRQAPVKAVPATPQRGEAADQTLVRINQFDGTSSGMNSTWSAATVDPGARTRADED